MHLRLLFFFTERVIPFFIAITYLYFCSIILIEVIRRYVFGDASPWGEMTARYAFVYLTYVAASEAIRHGKHIRIDVLPKKLGHPWAIILRIYNELLLILLAGFVIFFSMKIMKMQINFDIVMPAADFNMAFAQAALPLGWTLILLRLVQNWIQPVVAKIETQDGDFNG